MRVGVAGEERELKEDEAGVPERGDAAEEGEEGTCDEGLNDEEERRAEEGREGEAPSHGDEGWRRWGL